MLSKLRIEVRAVEGAAVELLNKKNLESLPAHRDEIM
jgi:hypothetical protein